MTRRVEHCVVLARKISLVRSSAKGPKWELLIFGYFSVAPHFLIMSNPHFCNFCKNHGVATRVSHLHRQNCPWKDCACILCSRIRQRNFYRRNLSKSSATSTATTLAASSASISTVTAASVIAAANSTKSTGVTSAAAARAGK